jgi:hypothetical protein
LAPPPGRRICLILFDRRGTGLSDRVPDDELPTLESSQPSTGQGARSDAHAIHTGECELDADRVSGIAAHIGARIAALAAPGEVLVSSTVKDLVAGSELRFRERDLTGLKGIPGEWRLHALLTDEPQLSPHAGCWTRTALTPNACSTWWRTAPTLRLHYAAMAVGRKAAGLLALALLVSASGCGSSKTASNEPGSSKPDVELQADTQATGGKATVFTASTGEKLAAEGGLYAVELRGVDLKRPQRAPYDRPDYLDRHRCDAKPCEWTVIPGPASTYEFRAFLIDLRSNESVAQSRPAQVVWKAPPRPQGLKFLVNGKTPPTTPLDGEDYSDMAAGKMQAEAR